MITRRARIGAIALLLLASCGSDKDDKPAPEARRVLSMYANPAAGEDPGAAAALAIDAGARGTFMAYAWSALEPVLGVFQLSDIHAALVDAVHRRGLTVLLGIQLINTVAKGVPLDLAAVPWNAPEMKTRFRTLIDVLAPLLAGRVAYLSIGNEVDYFLDYYDTSGGWPAYIDFYADAAAYVRERVPGVKVGVTVTYHGASTSARSRVQALNAASDVFIYTYYPIDERGHATGPGAPAEVLSRMVELAGGRPAVVQEIGTTSAPLVGGSEADQAEFLRLLFAAWAAIDPARMPFVSVFHLTDFSAEFVDFLAAFYGVPDSEEVKAFLGSLGLRRSDGTPKPAWDAFVRGAREAGLP